MKKGKLCFIVAVSSNIAFAAANISMALDRHMKCDYQLLIYSGDMSEKDTQLCNSLPRTQVVHYELDKEFVDDLMQNLPEGCRFKDIPKLMRFCHYEAFKLLESYEYVVWIDADMSVQDDLSGIIQYSPFGITMDTPWKVGDQFIKPVEGYDMEKDAYCSGIMCLHDSLPYEEIYKWLWEHTRKYASHLKNGDQPIINLMLQKFGIEPNVMPLNEYQCICGKKEAIDARVVHFGTDKKVWNTNILLDCFPEWYRLHKKWVEMGGSDFDRTNMVPKNAFYDYRILNEKYEESKKTRKFTEILFCRKKK